MLILSRCRIGAWHGRRSLSCGMSVHEPDADLERVYTAMSARVALAREQIAGPMNLSEKILFGHLDNANMAYSIVPGQSYIQLQPGRLLHLYIFKALYSI